jgi:glutaredoxin
MRVRVLLAIVAILFVVAGLAVLATAKQVDHRIVVASQDIPDVELYITSWCPYCEKAVSFFRARGIPFAAYDIEKDKNAAFRKKLLDAQKGVPFAIIYGQPVHGFSEQAYLRALKGRK